MFADGLQGLFFDAEAVAGGMTNCTQYADRVANNPLLRFTDNTDNAVGQIPDTADIIDNCLAVGSFLS